MKFALITGVSKGLGKSVATYLLESKINVLGISRTESETLVNIAEENDTIYSHYSCDLGLSEQVDEVLKKVLKELSTHDVSSIYVINNAATLEPINPVMKINNEQLQYHYSVNVLTPMNILNTFLQHYKDVQRMIIGVNVTSGVATRPIYGWSAYCSSKASINAYTKTIALEVAQLNTGNKIFAFNPGVMDTEMQEKIRSSDEHSFRDVEQFKAYKRNNILKDSDIVAGVLVDILTDEVNIQNGKIYDINDYV